MNPRVLAYMQLFRLPNVFTAVADVTMGFLFVKMSVQPVGAFFMLVAASCLLYSSGMVLNDLFDLEVDARERPDRPLPSGRISPERAERLGFGMLVAGPILAWLVSPWSGIVATLLAGFVWLYDAVAKRTWFGPVAMGGCRMLNVLLGMSVAIPWARPLLLPEVGGDQWTIAAGIGVYVAGLTWFANGEAATSDRRQLTIGLAVMVIGIVILSAFAWLTDKPLMFTGKMIWPTLLVLLMISVVRRAVTAIVAPTPEHVQQAVKNGILTLIVLDAAVVLAVLGPFPAVAVLALLVPTLLLGQWVYST